MSENEQVVDPSNSDPKVYSEDNDSFVPDPTDVTGTLDTSGTTGGEADTVEAVTPVFAAADAQNIEAAKDAVHGDGDAKVILPGDQDRTAEQAVEIIENKAEEVEENPVEVVDPSVTAAKKNAKSGKSTDPAQVEEAQKSQGAAGDLSQSTRTTENPTKS